MPCWKPPYGTLSSYDLKTGKLLWRHPFGQVQQWGFYMPESWGSVTIGGPVITKDRPDIHWCFDGQSRARHRPEDWRCSVEASGGCARSLDARSVYVQGQGVCRICRWRQRHPGATCGRSANRFRATEWLKDCHFARSAGEFHEESHRPPQSPPLNLRFWTACIN